MFLPVNQEDQHIKLASLKLFSFLLMKLLWADHFLWIEQGMQIIFSFLYLLFVVSILAAPQEASIRNDHAICESIYRMKLWNMTV